jgi:hypothetical protein
MLWFKKKNRLNKSEREEVVPRYKSTPPPYYQNDQKNEKFEQRAQNFELLIHYVIK